MLNKLDVATNVLKLRELRLDHGYTQAEVSKMIGLNEGKLGEGTNYGKRERGVISFGLTFIVRLAKLYEVDIEDLLIIEEVNDQEGGNNHER